MAHDESAACRCVSEHRPPVLEYALHHVFPIGLGGPDVPENRVYLCPTAHLNTHELLRLMLSAGRTLSNYELEQLEPRPVSRYAAQVARDGFTAWASHAGLPV